MLSDNNYFKPTILYKEFMILDLIEKNSNITQREISKGINVSVSMVNYYLDDYEKQGLIQRNYISTKSIDYRITKKGLERRKVLNIGYFNATQVLYNSAKSNIEQFLKQVEEKGFKDILLYGAGEVCEIMLHTIKSNNNISINALAIIDDDIKKIGNKLVDVPIVSIGKIKSIKHEGILISSFTNNEIIYKKLINIKYPNKKILQFFSLLN